MCVYVETLMTIPPRNITLILTSRDVHIDRRWQDLNNDFEQKALKWWGDKMKSRTNKSESVFVYSVDAVQLSSFSMHPLKNLIAHMFTSIFFVCVSRCVFVLVQNGGIRICEACCRVSHSSPEVAYFIAHILSVWVHSQLFLNFLNSSSCQARQTGRQ